MAEDNIEIDSEADRHQFISSADIADKDRLLSEMRVSSVNVVRRCGSGDYSAIRWTIAYHHDNTNVINNFNFLISYLS